jgi:hypothetical protein
LIAEEGSAAEAIERDFLPFCPTEAFDWYSCRNGARTCGGGCEGGVWIGRGWGSRGAIGGWGSRGAIGGWANRGAIGGG